MSRCLKENLSWMPSEHTDWGASFLPSWKWASAGYRYINPWTAGILNNEQLPSLLSRAETKTWFRGPQSELSPLFKPPLSGRAISCSNQSREGWKLKQSCSSAQAANTRNSASTSCPAQPSPTELRALQRRCLGKDSLPWTWQQEEGNMLLL